MVKISQKQEKQIPAITINIETSRKRLHVFFRFQMEYTVEHSIRKHTTNVCLGGSLCSYLLQLYHEKWGHQDKRHIRKMLETELGLSLNLDEELYEPCFYSTTSLLSFSIKKETSEAS
ncbi:hypothetical protein NPIL_473821 [Nephila pilipes]|uniref:Uncharacterized protein n=1 Tax=Nephila pilipes TaxID=299642 RepID=A0A8X6MRN9_NEPPI|nr:hypothetical protein NPIL_473821 [Nephila pilipes]